MYIVDYILVEIVARERIKPLEGIATFSEAEGDAGYNV